MKWKVINLISQGLRGGGSQGSKSAPLLQTACSPPGRSPALSHSAMQLTPESSIQTPFSNERTCVEQPVVGTNNLAFYYYFFIIFIFLPASGMLTAWREKGAPRLPAGPALQDRVPPTLPSCHTGAGGSSPCAKPSSVKGSWVFLKRGHQMRPASLWGGGRQCQARLAGAAPACQAAPCIIPHHLWIAASPSDTPTPP